MVAPRAGAWIETPGPRPSRPSRSGRPPRGGVDRNPIKKWLWTTDAGRPRAEAWIKTAARPSG